MNEAVIVAIIAGAVAIISASISFWAGRAVNKAQSFSINVDTLMKLTDKVESLSQDIIDIRNELDDVKDKNRMLWAYIYQLLDIMKQKRIKPPQPPEGLKDDDRMTALLNWIYE